MNESAFIGGFLGAFAFNALYVFIDRFACCDEEEEEAFWESHQFEDSLEKADDLCDVGYTFQRNEIIYKKISQKKWLAEILTPGDDQFKIGCELTIENYIYKKMVKSLGRLKEYDLSIKWPVLR